MLEYSKATPSDSKLLSKITLKSKAHWGYPQKWLDAWQEDLAVTSQFIENNTVLIASFDQKVIGFYSLIINNSTSFAYMQHLWVLPEFIGKGFGKQLFKHARNECISKNITGIELDADPNAQSFYEHMGMIKYDEIHSKVLDTKRIVPKMRLTF